MPLMDTADFARLRKLLALTASNNDGEALAAIRKANAMLERTKTHWFDVMDALERGSAPATNKPSAATEIDEAFDLVLCTARGSFREFILSLLEQWQDTGVLSPKQRAALLKSAERARNGEW